MFGFLKPRCRETNYRRVYAAICSLQRQKFGVPASILISYEAVFLYQLALDAGVTSPPSECTPTCCRLRNDWANNWELDIELAEYCVSFAVLLSQIKIDDDIRDSGSLSARAGHWMLKKAFRKSRDYFETLQPGFGSQVDQLVRLHLGMESLDLENLSSENKNSEKLKPENRSRNRGANSQFEGYSHPTGEAFGLAFGLFGKLCDQRGTNTTDLATTFQEIGYGIGCGILTSDCLFDARKDQKSGEYNPVRTTADAIEMKSAALTVLAQTGWQCEALRSTESISKQELTNITSRIIRYAFDRVASFEAFLPETKSRKQLRLNPLAKFRFGECDCIGECCCEMCCQACGEGASGTCTECGSYGVPGESCHSSGSHLACDPCLWCGDCCGGTQRDKRTKKVKPEPEIKSLIGSKGKTTVRLNPSGYIEIDGVTHPAKSEGTWIEEGEEVVVIEESGFGLMVRRVEGS